jgi:hypothetical protein
MLDTRIRHPQIPAICEENFITWISGNLSKLLSPLLYINISYKIHSDMIRKLGFGKDAQKIRGSRRKTKICRIKNKYLFSFKSFPFLILHFANLLCSLLSGYPSSTVHRSFIEVILPICNLTNETSFFSYFLFIFVFAHSNTSN